MTEQPPHTIREVVARGMCIGCGACSVATQGRIPLTLSRYGMYQAKLENINDSDIDLADRVCPFSDNSLNEDELSAPSTWGKKLSHDPRAGHFSTTWAGRKNASDDELSKHSSGGLTSWLTEKLLASGFVDGIIQVQNQGLVSTYINSYDVDSGLNTLKSHYTSTTLRDVILEVRGNNQKYAVVGLPCFIKAARLISSQDEVLSHQLTFFVGLVCGHLKSQLFGQSLAWQLGVKPAEVVQLDFRVKNSLRDVGQYDFGVIGRGDSELRLAQSSSLVGGNWGHGSFQPEACNFCDDVFAETADVVFGDAWLPEYRTNWRGTNIILSRNSIVDDLLITAQSTKQLEIHPITIEKIVESQAGNFRHRREGLQVRLHDDVRQGLSVPQKRVVPSDRAVSRHRRKIIRYRRYMSKQSFSLFLEACNTGEISGYLRRFSKMVHKYDVLNKPPFIYRFRSVIGRVLRQLKLGKHRP